MAELAEHDVEAGIGIGKRLGIALEKVDIDPGGDRVLARPLKQIGGEVERAAVTATTPVPQATSSTRWPGDTCANLTSLAAGSVLKIAAPANDAQCSRSLALSLANGSASAVVMGGSGPTPRSSRRRQNTATQRFSTQRGSRICSCRWLAPKGRRPADAHHSNSAWLGRADVEMHSSYCRALAFHNNMAWGRKGSSRYDAGRGTVYRHIVDPI
jgi:hypothetical protein